MLHFEDFDLKPSRTLYTAPWVLYIWLCQLFVVVPAVFFKNPCHLCLGSFKFGASGRGPTGGQWGGMVGETRRCCGNGWGCTRQVGSLGVQPMGCTGHGRPRFPINEESGLLEISSHISMDFNQQLLYMETFAYIEHA